MNKLKHWAQAERGRITALANYVGISTPYAHRMVSGNKPVSVMHAAAIEQFTNGAVTRQDMFPEAWQRIWPELAVQQSAGQGA